LIAAGAPGALAGWLTGRISSSTSSAKVRDPYREMFGNSLEEIP